MALGLQKLAGGQKGPHLLGRKRLAMHGAKPAQAHQLGDAAGVRAIGLDWHGLERGAHMRVSSSSTGKPAAFISAKSPCDNGPASRPIRAMGVPCAASQVISASGSQATFASFRILPCTSTMPTLALSKDTSIPAYCSIVVPQ